MALQFVVPSYLGVYKGEDPDDYVMLFELKEIGALDRNKPTKF